MALGSKRRGIFDKAFELRLEAKVEQRVGVSEYEVAYAAHAERATLNEVKETRWRRDEEIDRGDELCEQDL